ncbi:Rap1a/Tai family immunity protein [Acidomonas methanolica]|uniref:Rap1a/Tai family immunity protein n=1 Tax=Acidomonas methanolica TaxID=437 RepID=UPI00211A868F
MRTIIAGLFLSTVALSAGSAFAQRLSPMTAEQFGRICTSEKLLEVCDAYISGVADAGALAHLNDKAGGDSASVAGFCIPAGATTPSMRGHIVSWLRAHRDVWKKPVGESVFAALHDSYPCASGGAK